MSGSDSFQQRGAALENQFFAKVDQKLLEKLRNQEDLAALQATLGVCVKTATEIQQAGVSSPCAAALRMVPLVAIAWADGRIEAAEKEIVLKSAAAQGIQQDQPAGQLLSHWLSSPLPAGFLQTWCDYAAALIKTLTPDAADALKKSVIEEAKQVAASTGGVLGWGAVSEGESAVMKSVEAALTRKNA